MLVIFKKNNIIIRIVAVKENRFVSTSHSTNMYASKVGVMATGYVIIK